MPQQKQNKDFKHKSTLKLLVFSSCVIAFVYSFAGIAIAENLLPKLPPLPDNANLSTISTLFINKFKFSGNTVFSDEKLSTLTGRYENREITAEELQDIRRILSKFYLSQGYINSGAVFPNQKIKNGIVSVNIIEGKLTRVEISGNKRLKSEYITERIQPGSKKEMILNINDLQNRLKLLKQNALIRQVNASLSPGTGLGTSNLKVDIEEENSYRLGLRYNNHRASSLGEHHAAIKAGHHNLTGRGDRFDISYGLSQGLNNYSLSYSIPLNHRDMILTLFHEVSDAEVVSIPLNSLDIENESYASSIAIEQPFYKTTSSEFTLGLKFEKKHNKTFLLGRPFSFSPGVQDGESDISVLRFSQDFVTRRKHQVIAAHSSFSVGLDIWDSTRNNDDPDGTFITWLGQFQWLWQSKLLNSQLLFKTDLSLSNDQLLPMEKFTIGGAASVRGYPENYLTSDSGVVSSVELRIPIARLGFPGMSKNNQDGVIQIAPFFDYGQGWNQKTHTLDHKNISSAGIGFRWLINPKSLVEIYWGKTLRNLGSFEDKTDLQSNGFHFNIRLGFL